MEEQRSYNAACFTFHHSPVVHLADPIHPRGGVIDWLVNQLNQHMAIYSERRRTALPVQYSVTAGHNHINTLRAVTDRCAEKSKPTKEFRWQQCSTNTTNRGPSVPDLVEIQDESGTSTLIDKYIWSLATSQV